VPLNLHWGEELYKDNVNITPEDFYSRLAKADALPTTSQPSAGEFLEAYEEMAKQADELVVPLISSGISGTVDSAMMAAKEFQKVPVHVVDSKTTSAGLSLLVKAMVIAAESGSQVDEVLGLAERIVQDERIFFVVDTLKYLHMGGRIGGASAFLGSALDLKPILTLTEEGKIDALEKVRTKKKAVKRLIELAVEKAGGKPAHVAVIHAEARTEAESLKTELEAQINCLDCEIYIISPVIGTHTGPGALAVAVHTVN
jgi:DegV family protein with EDD domain